MSRSLHHNAILKSMLRQITMQGLTLTAFTATETLTLVYTVDIQNVDRPTNAQKYGKGLLHGMGN